MFIYKGYRWTAWDVIIAVSTVALLGYAAAIEIAKHGISLASVVGSIWVIGSLAFVFLYQLPIFGGSVQGEKLLKEKKVLTSEEAKIVVGRGFYKKMSPKTIKLFAIFFLVSGVLTVVGIVADI